MAERLAQKILTHVTQERYAPSSVADLAADFGLGRTEVQAAVDRLLDEGHVVYGEGRVALPPPGREVEGIFRAHERGFGFLIPDQPLRHGDLFVPPRQTMNAMTGDRVRVAVSMDRGRGGGDSSRSPFTARVIEILQRSERRYTGTLIQSGKRYEVLMDGKAFVEPVLVEDPSIKSAAPGDKVVLELIGYATRPGQRARGVIVEVLGESGEPDVETAAVIQAYGLRDGFDKDVLQQAREAAQFMDDAGDNPADRLDLRETFICTIDPPSAKDFDDAISIDRFESPESDGAVWELGVHIADVAHFVRAGSALDLSAYERGNSTYLPQRVLPMLPEVLSNGVCSLSQDVDRFAKTCFIRYNAEGEVLSARFARSIIRSAKRMTYLEAQGLIDDDLRAARRHAKTEPKFPRELIAAVKRMDDLARIIRERRMRQGMIVLGLPEVELVYDESGRVIDAEPEDNAYTHTIIEMFMVEANEASARLFERLNVPMIRRVHPTPEQTDTSDIRSHARRAGVNLPKMPTRQDLQALLEATRGTPSERACHLAVLKTLMRAEYSPALVGHYALASEHYTHFTSPIRRYPDLVVHRGINAYLEATDNGTKTKSPKKQIGRAVSASPDMLDELQLRDLGRHCSTTERTSEAAEKELRMALVLDLLSALQGEDFPATCTGVTHRGVYMQIDKYLVDGFILTRDLPDNADAWRFDDQTGSMRSGQSNHKIGIGDTFTVRIAGVDLQRRELDLEIVSGAGATGSSRKKTKSRRRDKEEGDTNDRPSRRKQSTGEKSSTGSARPKSKRSSQSKPKKPSTSRGSGGGKAASESRGQAANKGKTAGQDKATGKTKATGKSKKKKSKGRSNAKRKGDPL